MISEEQDGTKQKLCRIWTNSALGAGARMRKIAVVTLFTSDPFTPLARPVAAMTAAMTAMAAMTAWGALLPLRFGFPLL